MRRVCAPQRRMCRRDQLLPDVPASGNHPFLRSMLTLPRQPTKVHIADNGRALLKDEVPMPRWVVCKFALIELNQIYTIELPDGDPIRELKNRWASFVHGRRFSQKRQLLAKGDVGNFGRTNCMECTFTYLLLVVD